LAEHLGGGEAEELLRRQVKGAEAAGAVGARVGAGALPADLGGGGGFRAPGPRGRRPGPVPQARQPPQAARGGGVARAGGQPPPPPRCRRRGQAEGPEEQAPRRGRVILWGSHVSFLRRRAGRPAPRWRVQPRQAGAWTCRSVGRGGSWWRASRRGRARTAG